MALLDHVLSCWGMIELTVAENVVHASVHAKNTVCTWHFQ